MTASHRIAVVSAALTLAVLPSIASAQSRQQVPGPDTKRVLVTTFRGDVEGGVKAANEIRDRIKGEYSIRQLMPTSKKDIDSTLARSGFKIDSALSPNDIKELGRMVRGDEIIDGTVQKTSAGYRISARMFLPKDVSLSQPLVTNLETNNFEDAAKQIVDEYDRARKQIPDNQACENGIRNNTPSVAIAAARKGIQNYPKATITRLCLASSYAAMKTTADSAGPWKDSVIAITKTIIDLDKVSILAYKLQIDAYRSVHDTANLVQALLGYIDSDPSNSAARRAGAIEMVGMLKAPMAVRVARDLVNENPGDLDNLRLYWLVLRAAKDFKESVKVGKQLVGQDPSAADTSYYLRQVQDLITDSSYAKAAEMAGEASTKFPTRTDFLMMKAQNERRTAQLPAAKASLERVLVIDQKANGVNYLLAQVSSEMGSTADAIKYAKLDAADPANKERAATLLVSMGKKAYDAANATKTAEDFKKALPFLQASDEIAPSANASFLIGVSAYQAMSQSAEMLKASKTCGDFKDANDLLLLVNIHMMKGAVVDQNTAKLILGGAGQFGPFIDGSMKKFCK